MSDTISSSSPRSSTTACKGRFKKPRMALTYLKKKTEIEAPLIAYAGLLLDLVSQCTKVLLQAAEFLMAPVPLNPTRNEKKKHE